MIDEETTKERFGYYARDLKPHSHKRIVVICDDCGKLREISKNAYRFRCRSCGNRFAKLGKKNPNWKPKMKRICIICGKEFTRFPSQIKGKKRGLFCSKSCAMKARTGKKAAAWCGGRIDCICQTCGKHFKKSPSIIEMGQGLFCSLHCARKDQKGSKNPNWQGGTSFEPYCSKWDEKFREYIRNKFNRNCFLCSKTEVENARKLSVHHVNYDKLCGCAETEEDKKHDDASCQFVPLCTSCNSKVNRNRDHWETLIKNKMKNKLNGWYI